MPAPRALTRSAAAGQEPSFSDERRLDRVASQQLGVSRQRFVVRRDRGVKRLEQVACRGPARGVPLDGAGQEPARAGIRVVTREDHDAAQQRIVQALASERVDGGDATDGRAVMRQPSRERVLADHCSCAGGSDGGSAGALALDSHSRNCSR